MESLLEPIASLPPRVHRALVESARGVVAGQEAIEDRFCLSPRVMSPAECAELDALGRAVHVVLRESVGALRTHPALLARTTLGPRGLARVRERFDLGQAQFAALAAPTLLEAHRPELPDPILRARADAFSVAGRLRVFELNVGSMLCNVMDRLAAAFGSVPELAPLLEGASAPACSAELADALLRRHRMRFGIDPTHAARAFHPDAESSDAAGLAEALEARGVRVLRAGPGDLSSTRDELRCRGVPVTLLTEECTAIPSTLSRFGLAARAAYKLHRRRARRAGAAVVYPSPYEPLFNKAYLALLSEGALDGLVDPASLARVRASLAWTRIARSGPTTWLDGRVADLRELALAHQGELVLKPIVGHTSVGVVLGDRVSEERWRDALDDGLRARDCVLQERLRPEPFELLLPSGERATAVADTSPVFVDGRAVAVFSRFSVGGELLHFIGHGERRGAHGLVPVWLRRDEARGATGLEAR